MNIVIHVKELHVHIHDMDEAQVQAAIDAAARALKVPNDALAERLAAEASPPAPPA